ncbi:MAG: large-conductance mechanosensitive channel protein MscL [Bdellovibrionota bacterium]
MSIVKEFREFAIKGNVVDMAVGIIIGAAFGKIVSSLVSDVLMPPIGMLIGGVDFTSLAFTLKPATATSAAVVVKYGVFVQTVVDFLIVAAAVFIMVKMINRLKKKAEEPAVAPAPPRQEVLLAEIRDLLKAEAPTANKKAVG